MTLVLLNQCDKINPKNPVDFTDAEFFNALVEEGVDTNGDGVISFIEAKAVKSLDVSGNINPGFGYQSRGISNIEGIESFINLDTFRCSINEIISMDFSSNTALKFLDCSHNQLTGLDVSNNSELEYLDCSDNHLSSLDISVNKALEALLIGNMETLEEVCIWTMPFPPEGVFTDTTGSPNVIFTSECSN